MHIRPATDDRSGVSAPWERVFPDDPPHNVPPKVLDAKLAMNDGPLLGAAQYAFGLRGVVRGRRVKTTTPVATLSCPTNRVNRVFQAPRPNALRLAHLTYVATQDTKIAPHGSSGHLPDPAPCGAAPHRTPVRAGKKRCE